MMISSHMGRVRSLVMSPRLLAPSRLLLPALLLALFACVAMIEVQTGEGLVNVKGDFGLGMLPPGAQPLPFKAKVDVPPYGEIEIDVYDTDGDGKADMGGPVPPGNKYFKGTLEPSVQQPLTIGGGPHGAGAGAELERRDRIFVPYDHAPAVSKPVVFDQSVEDFLDDFGMSQVVEGDNAFHDTIELLAADEDLSLSSGLWLDVRVHWNTQAGWVNIEQFPSLQYEFQGLAEVPGTWPKYMVARVVGDGAAVLNWLGHMGFTDVGIADVVVSGLPTGRVQVDQLGIVINTAAGLAQISVDGVISYVPLSW
jgi:hypothetical protein